VRLHLFVVIEPAAGERKHGSEYNTAMNHCSKLRTKHGCPNIRDNSHRRTFCRVVWRQNQPVVQVRKQVLHRPIFRSVETLLITLAGIPKTRYFCAVFRFNLNKNKSSKS
jgi:hypothetical protein